MVSYLSCTTLDIIGLAGFDYSFDALQHLLNDNRDENELSSAFSKLFTATMQFNALTILKRQFAILRLITFDSRSRVINHSQKAVQRIGRQLVEDKKRALQASQEKVQAKDLLTLLIKANMTERGDGVDRQMSDEEVMNQIPTFLIAGVFSQIDTTGTLVMLTCLLGKCKGHETTSTATSWALYSLGIHKNVQDRLRQEISGVSTETPTMEGLNDLPYLDCVVREVLRYHSVVAGTVRVASQDDVVPLDTPFYDRYGEVHDRIKYVILSRAVVPTNLL
jgi:cytochrome P450